MRWILGPSVREHSSMREKRGVYRRSCRVHIFDQPQEVERNAGINLGKTDDPCGGRQAAMKEGIRFYSEDVGDGTLGA